MGVEQKITCDVCGKETGQAGSGSKGEWISCDTVTPGGAVNLLYKSKTSWAVCAKCWNTMWKAVREYENPEVECKHCGKSVLRDDAATVHYHKGACFTANVKPKITVRSYKAGEKQ